MRITDAQTTAMMRGAMNANADRMGKLMQQMSSGDRIIQPSDDPIASVRLLRLQREEASLAQFRSNMGALSSSLAIQEAKLKAVSDTMLNLQDLMLWAGNGANANQDVAAIAGEMASIEQTLVNFLSVRDEEGRYLPTGTRSNVPAVKFNEATQSYEATGNDQHRQAPVANGVLLAENVTEQEVFGGDLNFLNQLHEVVKMMQDSALDAGSTQKRARQSQALEGVNQTHGKLMATVSELGGQRKLLDQLEESNTYAS